MPLTVRRFALALCGFICAGFQHPAAAANPLAVPTRGPHGPFRVAGTQLVDADGIPFLIRGTQTSAFRFHSARHDARSSRDFGPHSATSLSAIRLRLNMNALRIPVDITEADQPGFYPELRRLVRLANQSDLLVILAASDPGSAMPGPAVLEFWSHCAAAFKENPNVIFDAFDKPYATAVPENAGSPHALDGWEFWRHGGKSQTGAQVFGMQDVVQTIRAAGAPQPVVLMGWNDAALFQGFDAARLAGAENILYEFSPGYETARTDADRDAQFGFLANSAPVIANDWDLHLDDPKACRAIPADTEGASKLVLDNIAYFDAHNISWTVSAYERGKLLKDTVNLIATKLEDGITCRDDGVNSAGMGRLILSRMFGAEEGKLVVVNVSGGISLARGGYGIAYGRIMAKHDSVSHAPGASYRLGDLAVRITDSKNVTRPARMNWASAGWGSLNFIIPASAAPGSGRLTIERGDGTQDSADVFIADTAPGLYTALNCQGPALGTFTRANAQGGTIESAPISNCKTWDSCSTVSIPVTGGTRTTVRLFGNGFRNAKSPSEIDVTIAGVRVPVLTYGPGKDAGVDELIVAIPPSLRGTGETDLICHVNGRLANVVRISIGGSRRAS